MKNNQHIQATTERWLEQVVIGYNFCPFAKRVLRQELLQYHISSQLALEPALMELVEALQHLDEQEELETTLLIFPNAFEDFDDYLDGLAVAEALLVDLGYEGIYQLASFHPHYQFEGEAADASTHYTNRSPYPMWHILREASIETAIAHYPDPEGIPARNAELATQQSPEAWAAILRGCYELDHN